MIRSFLESIKYMGHLWPLAIIRIILGSQYLQLGLTKIQGVVLQQPYMSETIRLGLQEGKAPEWYSYFFEAFVQQNWQLFTYLSSYAILAVGISYVLGFMVRPFALVGVLISLHGLWTMGSASQETYQLLFIFHVLMFSLGAGRCLGFDYYYFRSRRGLWW